MTLDVNTVISAARNFFDRLSGQRSKHKKFQEVNNFPSALVQELQIQESSPEQELANLPIVLNLYRPPAGMDKMPPEIAVGKATATIHIANKTLGYEVDDNGNILKKFVI